MKIVNRNNVRPFITKDSSEIRELLASRNSPLKNLSLAEAIVFPGESTFLHYHTESEEIYYICQGKGVVEVSNETQPIKPLDAIAIPARKKHRITNTGKEPLVFLCSCSPEYYHETTVLVENTKSVKTLKRSSKRSRKKRKVNR
jgi:mannose-6-phosphate isomerase-like protein (cupin superfamily)